MPGHQVQEDEGSVDSLSEIVFLGTGSSAGTPMLSCLMNPDCGCLACHSAAQDHACKNARGNPSLLICFRSPKGDTSWVVIDAGKTFKRAACRFFPKHKVTDVHAVVLTHEHADAVLGLDDMRETKAWGSDWKDKGKIPATPVFLSEATYKHLQGVFPYLMPREKEQEVIRLVSQLQYTVICPFDTFSPVEGLPMTALPTVHGSDCCCLGFDFGQKQRVVYLSDFNELPDETYAAIGTRHVDLLVIDTLRKDADATTHIGLPTAIQIAKRVRATRVLLIGMSHSFGDHDENNRELRERADLQGLDIQLAYDGQSIRLAL